MSDPAIALFVSDVDGTLVDHDKQLRPATIDAVERLRAAGIGFTLISARPPSGLLRLAGLLNIGAPLAAFNGGTLVTPTGTVLQRQTVDPEAVRGMFALAAGTGAAPWLFAGGRWYAHAPDDPHAARERLSSEQDPQVVGDFAPFYDEVDKITFVSDEPGVLGKLLERGRAEFGDAANIGQSQTYYLDVTAPAANKGDGLVALAAAMNVPMAAVAAIGDMANDVPMFERAALSIAMGQAPDAVRAAAMHVTASNNEDGVAKAIDAFILPREPTPYR